MATLDPRAVLEGRVGPRRSSVGFVIGVAVLSLLTLVSLVAFLPEGGPTFWLVGLILALLPAPITVAGVLVLDRLEPEPTRNLVIAFLWGAGVATLLALIVNTTGLIIGIAALGERLATFVSVAIGAPLVEESLKGSVLLGLLWFRRRELDGPTDGIVYAGMVGLGFAIVENVGYYARIGAESGEALAVTFLIRGVLAPLCHPLFTSMTGIAVAYAALSRRGAVRFVLPVLGWLGAVILHSIWNSSSFFLGFPLGLIVSWALLLVVLIGVLALVFRDRRRIVGSIARYLPGYVPAGVVTPQDIAMLARLSSRRLARVWARRVGGTRASRIMGDYQLAATELAILHSRAERGVEDSPRFYPRRDALVYLMGAAQQAFRTGLPSGPRPPWARGGPSGFDPQAGPGRPGGSAPAGPAWPASPQRPGPPPMPPGGGQGYGPPPPRPGPFGPPPPGSTPPGGPPPY